MFRDVLGRMPPSGIAVTGAGYLPCRHVIHINARLDLTDTIVRVLLEAERLQDRHVAFPALGTGLFLDFVSILEKCYHPYILTTTFDFFSHMLLWWHCMADKHMDTVLITGRFLNKFNFRIPALSVVTKYLVNISEEKQKEPGNLKTFC